MSSIELRNANVHIWGKDMIYSYADIKDQALETLLKLGRGRAGSAYVNDYLEYNFKGARICLRC